MLVPIFFITVGARTDLRVLNRAVPTNREGLIMAIFLIGVAIVGKAIASQVLVSSINPKLILWRLAWE